MELVRHKVIELFIRTDFGSEPWHRRVVEVTQDEFERLTEELHVTERYKPNDQMPGYEDRDMLLVPYKGVYIPVVWS